MLIFGKLHAISRVSGPTQHARQSKAGKRKCVTCEYRFDDHLVCKDGFPFLHNIGTKQLKNLQRHLKDSGPIPRQHGLLGHVPATTYPFEVVNDAVHFIRKFTEVLVFHSQQHGVEEQTTPLFTYQPLSITRLSTVSMLRPHN